MKVASVGLLPPFFCLQELLLRHYSRCAFRLVRVPRRLLQEPAERHVVVRQHVHAGQGSASIRVKDRDVKERIERKECLFSLFN